MLVRFNEPLSVCKHEGEYYSVSNRRLTVLLMHQALLRDKVILAECVLEAPNMKFFSALTTATRGLSIELHAVRDDEMDEALHFHRPLFVQEAVEQGSPQQVAPALPIFDYPSSSAEGEETGGSPVSNWHLSAPAHSLMSPLADPNGNHYYFVKNDEDSDLYSDCSSATVHSSDLEEAPAEVWETDPFLDGIWQVDLADGGRCDGVVDNIKLDAVSGEFHYRLRLATGLSWYLSARAVARGDLGRRTRNGDWFCTSCRLALNYARRETCYKCGWDQGI